MAFVLNEYETKERILTRLHEKASVCAHCDRKTCTHTNRRLPAVLMLDDVLWAVSLDAPLFSNDGSK